MNSIALDTSRPPEYPPVNLKINLLSCLFSSYLLGLLGMFPYPVSHSKSKQREDSRKIHLKNIEAQNTLRLQWFWGFKPKVGLSNFPVIWNFSGGGMSAQRPRTYIEECEGSCDIRWTHIPLSFLMLSRRINKCREYSLWTHSSFVIASKCAVVAALCCSGCEGPTMEDARSSQVL